MNVLSSKQLMKLIIDYICNNYFKDVRVYLVNNIAHIYSSKYLRCDSKILLIELIVNASKVDFVYKH